MRNLCCLNPRLPNPLIFFRLVKILRTFKPSIVHTWMYHADLIGGLASRFAGIKALGWSIRQSNLAPGLNSRMILLIARLCALLSRRIPRKILTFSESARRTHVGLGYTPKKMIVIPNGFDLTCFCPDPEAYAAVRAELGVALDTPLVGVIARYDPQKNLAGFVKAAELVMKSRSDVHFLLAGKGVDASNDVLQSAIRDRGLLGNVHLLGSRDDVPRLMASLDVLASSSHGEAFPNVLGEAMACGVPCVVTDAGDSADIVGESGRVVPVGDMKKLAEGVLNMLNLSISERRVLRERARQRVHDHYEIGRVVRRYETFYLSLLK